MNRQLRPVGLVPPRVHDLRAYPATAGSAGGNPAPGAGSAGRLDRESTTRLVVAFFTSCVTGQHGHAGTVGRAGADSTRSPRPKTCFSGGPQRHDVDQS